ncbi:hypothetical protein PV392_23460 [Streptomyces sp. ME03-5709C]|nr:hypothetical protein [Streptomyces sp. ME03-5709C]
MSSLPPRPADFTGRTGDLAQLDRAAAVARRVGGGMALVGPAGVGKTATAVCWATRQRNTFPDGRFFIDLRGHAEGPPLTPREVMAEVLCSIGADPDQVSGNPVAAYRRALAGIRALFLLDDAVDVDQVRPLLSVGPGSLVLVTSRNHMGGLLVAGGAAVLGLGPLPSSESTRLIARVMGARRAAAEPTAVAELATLCGHLPLALRIAAANLVTHPHCTVADHVAGLRERGPLDGLAVPGDRRASLRTALDLSYRRLEPGPRRLLAALGTLPGDGATVAGLAAFADKDPGEVARHLDLLFAEHLVEFRGGGRFTVPRLVQEFARGLGVPATRVG